MYGLWLYMYILALGNHMGFSPRSTKLLSFTMPYLLEDATPENLPYQLLLYGVVNRSLLGWTEQIWQSSLWRAELINLLQHMARYDCVMLLVLILGCLFIIIFIMPSVPIYKNTDGSAVPTHYLQQPRIDWYEGDRCWYCTFTMLLP